MSKYTEAVDAIMDTLILGMDYEDPDKQPYCATVFPRDAGYPDLPASMSCWGKDHASAKNHLQTRVCIEVDGIIQEGDDW